MAGILGRSGKRIKDDLLHLVDEDTNAFNKIMNAFSLPKKTEEEKALRSMAIQEATKYAIEVPFKTLQRSFDCFEICEQMIEMGNPNSVTDAAVGVLCARTACIGAFMNMKINCASLEDKDFVADILAKGQKLVDEACRIEKEYTAKVMEMISK